MSLYTISMSRVLSHQPVPHWSSAALKGLYDERTSERRMTFDSRTSKIKRMFKGRSSIADWKKELTESSITRSGASRWKVIKPIAGERKESIGTRSETNFTYESRESFATSTRATVRSRSRSFEESEVSLVAEERTQDNESNIEVAMESPKKSRATRRREKQEASTQLHLPLSATNVNTKDVAASMGMSFTQEAGAQDMPNARPDLDTVYKTSPPSSQSQGSSNHSSRRYSPVHQHSLQITRRRSKSPDQEQLQLASQSENNCSPAKEPPNMRPHGKERANAPSDLSFSAQQASEAQSYTVEQSSRRFQPARHIPLSALRHMPKADTSKKSSSKKSRSTGSSKKKAKVIYYYDSQRGVMIRRGLYDDEHRPKESVGEGTDLFKKIRDASIWSKMAELVLW